MTLSPVTSPVETPPVYLLAGGHWNTRRSPDPLLMQCLTVPGLASPSIAYIGAASHDDPGFFRRLASAFRDAGSGQVRLVRLAAPGDDTALARRQLESADIVFMSGGDVEAGMHCLHRHALAPFLRHLHRNGKPFFGLSAGSIMLAQCWVRWADPDDDSSASVFHCTGIAPVLCDTHAEEDQWQELKTLLRLLPRGTEGYGIPAGGGLGIGTDRGIAPLGRPVTRFRHEPGRIRELPALLPDS